MTTNLDRAMLEVLQSIATPEEINTLVNLLNEMSHGHIEPWFTDFIIEIVGRLDRLIAAQKNAANAVSE